MITAFLETPGFGLRYAIGLFFCVPLLEEISSLLEFQRLSTIAETLKVPADYCAQAASQKTCPMPPSYDSIVIEKYLGKWFKIGSTARSKLQNEAGLACYQANYSLATPRALEQGAKIAVIHRGFPKLGSVSKLGVTHLSTAATTGVYANTCQICNFLAPESPLRDVLYEISRVVVEIFPTHASHASILSQAIVNISSFLQNIESGLSNLAANVTMILIINGKVNQAIGTKHTNLESLNKLVRLAMSQQSAITELVSDIGVAQDAIIEVAKSLVGNMGLSSYFQGHHLAVFISTCLWPKSSCPFQVLAWFTLVTIDKVDSQQGQYSAMASCLD